MIFCNFNFVILIFVILILRHQCFVQLCYDWLSLVMLLAGVCYLPCPCQAWWKEEASVKGIVYGNDAMNYFLHLLALLLQSR